MRFDIGMGMLELPRDNCVICIATDRYMACTTCEFKERYTAHAKLILDKMNEELNKEEKNVYRQEKNN